MRTKLSVMWDYHADDPIWGKAGSVGLEGLGLSDELCAALRRWSAALTEEMWKVLDSKDQTLEPEVQRLDDVGRDLARLVQDELGDGYVITFVGVDASR